MYFTDTPALNRCEAMMKQTPLSHQRGSGRKQRPLHYTKKDCDCRYCLYHQKKKGCTVSECPVLDIRLNCGTASFYEAVTAAFRNTEHSAFRRRLDQYIKKDGGSMIYENGWHKRSFKTELHKLRKPDRKRLAVLYLLTAGDALWRKVNGALKNGQIDFEAVHLGGVDPDSYALWKAAKEIRTGKKQISLCELANKENISDRAFRLITQAMTIARFGAYALNGMEELR